MTDFPRASLNQVHISSKWYCDPAIIRKYESELYVSKDHQHIKPRWKRYRPRLKAGSRAAMTEAAILPSLGLDHVALCGPKCEEGSRRNLR
jgi:hypothetical protein